MKLSQRIILNSQIQQYRPENRLNTASNLYNLNIFRLTGNKHAMLFPFGERPYIHQDDVGIEVAKSRQAMDRALLDVLELLYQAPRIPGIGAAGN